MDALTEHREKRFSLILLDGKWASTLDGFNWKSPAALAPRQKVSLSFEAWTPELTDPLRLCKSRMASSSNKELFCLHWNLFSGASFIHLSQLGLLDTSLPLFHQHLLLYFVVLFWEFLSLNLMNPLLLASGFSFAAASPLSDLTELRS